MLARIREALEAIDSHVYYGGVTGIEPADVWDYIVFARGPLRRNPKGNTAYSHTINVVVVREEYVPEETLYQVINAMESIPGVRLDASGAEFDYDRKTGTKTIVEMAALPFTWVQRKDGAS